MDTYSDTSCSTSLQNVATEGLKAGGMNILLGLKFFLEVLSTSSRDVDAEASLKVCGAEDVSSAFEKKAFNLTVLKNLNSSTLVVNESAFVTGTKDRPLDRTEVSELVNRLFEMLMTFSTSDSASRRLCNRCRLPPRRVGRFWTWCCIGRWTVEVDLKNAAVLSWRCRWRC